MAGDERLDATSLASRAAVPLARIDALVDAGVLRPGPDGRFVIGDLQRIQIAGAYERGGIDLELLGKAIAAGRMSFEFTDRIYPPASPPSGRTVGDLMEELGPLGALVPDVLMAMGLSRPTPDRALAAADEEALRRFVAAWTTPPVDAAAAVRAARMVGDAARRVTEGWVALFVEAIDLPPERSATLTVEELGPRLFEPGIRVASVMEPTMLWLLRRHMEQALNEANVEAAEFALDAEGIRPRSRTTQPAIVFADLTGYTTLTEERGDQQAARSAEVLATLAADIAERYRGRLVKQLGDGVMLAFDEAVGAIEAARALVAAAASSGDLPALHVGLSAGPVVERDGDVYGRTVIIAARLSGVAGPGEIVLDASAVGTTGATEVEAIGPVTLKGFSRPVEAFRLR